MVKVNELRIGDLVQTKDGVIAVEDIMWNGINETSSESANYKEAEMEGIPLSEEWLQKMGFQDGEMWRVYHTDIRIDKYITCLQGWLNNAWRVTLKDSIPHCLGRQFQYVHEIQNLYFALTGEELTVTLELSKP